MRTPKKGPQRRPYKSEAKKNLRGPAVSDIKKETREERIPHLQDYHQTYITSCETSNMTKMPLTYLSA